MNTTPPKRKQAVADDYLDLIRRFPLRPIRTREEYERAGGILLELVGSADDPGLSDAQSDYADILTHLVRQWDERHSGILAEANKLSPVEALKFLMAENGMNTTDLGQLLGSGVGQASLILNGKRELSKSNIRILTERFHVSPALFL